MAIVLVLLDDHPLFREGLRKVLDAAPEFTVAGEAADARSALELIEASSPSVVVADVSLPAMTGIEFARDLARRAPLPHVLILTMHARPELASEAFEAGARGYALKTEPPSSIVEAIRTVARGELYLSPAIPRSVLEGHPADASPLRELSPREREIFRLAVGGYSNENIARELDISIKTVQTHRAKINQKLGVHSTGELVRYAVRRGLMSE